MKVEFSFEFMDFIGLCDESLNATQAMPELIGFSSLHVGARLV
jgi:hypothetical protein